jgi:SRSO17 transposase
VTEIVDAAMLDRWDAELTALTDSMSDLFARPEPARTFGDFTRAMLSTAERKNSWGLAEQAGYANPKKFQTLLDESVWDADVLRDRVRDLVVEHLADPGAVLVVDDTQSIKKGVRSVGVAPQHCGLTGQVENCQCMVMLTYASDVGHAFVNRALYLPSSWTDDPARCREAGVPADVEFATKPQLAAAMVERECAAGTVFGWVAADSGYGVNRTFRDALYARDLRFVVEISVNFSLADPSGARITPAQVYALLEPESWQRRSQGAGSKGMRTWDWAWCAAVVPDEEPRPGFAHHLLIRRSKNKIQAKDGTWAHQIAYFLVHAPHDTPLNAVVKVAGVRWKIEEDNANSKDSLGLDHYQVRKWRPWHRYVTICMLAYAYLVVTRAQLGKAEDPSPTPAAIEPVPAASATPSARSDV